MGITTALKKSNFIPAFESFAQTLYQEMEKNKQNEVTSAIASKFLALSKDAPEEDVRRTTLEAFKYAAETGAIRENAGLIQGLAGNRLEQAKATKNQTEEDAFKSFVQSAYGIEGTNGMNASGLSSAIQLQMHSTKEEKVINPEGQAIGQTFMYRNGNWVEDPTKKRIIDSTTHDQRLQRELTEIEAKAKIQKKYALEQVWGAESIRKRFDEQEKKPISGKGTPDGRQLFYDAKGQYTFSFNEKTGQPKWEPYGGSSIPLADPSLTKSRELNNLLKLGALDKQTLITKTMAVNNESIAFVNEMINANIMSQADVPGIDSPAGMKDAAAKLYGYLKGGGKDKITEKLKNEYGEGTDAYKRYREQLNDIIEVNRTLNNINNKVIGGALEASGVINKDWQKAKAEAIKKHGIDTNIYDKGYNAIQQYLDDPLTPQSDGIRKAIKAYYNIDVNGTKEFHNKLTEDQKAKIYKTWDKYNKE